MRQHLIGAGFTLLGASRLHRLAPDSLRGAGAILMFHHVRPFVPQAFAPNRLLEIEPDFLEAVILCLKARGYEILSLDLALARLDQPAAARRRFAVLTFDDGYRDFSTFALPVLERHQAPFTLFVTSGFADRTAHLWWLELEEAVRRATDLPLSVDRGATRLPARTAGEKAAAFRALYSLLRRCSEDDLRSIVAGLCAAEGVDGRALVEALCLDWSEIVALAAHPLATIGAHTLSHPRLSRVDEAVMHNEIAGSRSAIAARIGRPVEHLAYPVGGVDAAGPREFATSAALGFASAVTTRPGLIHPEHRAFRTALPRLSVNGLWQDIRHFDVLLSGTAFALWNRGRRVNAA
jgi:peptidoglycan/xylan/chitin deacetylase (PgdA/CDA1 family)